MKKNKPIIFVLFGATGDLALQKIFPAFHNLFHTGLLGSDFHLIAVSRRHWSNEDFIDFLKNSHDNYEEAFLDTISYVEVDIDSSVGYDDLKSSIEHMNGQVSETQVFVYLSLAPKNHVKTITNLAKVQILHKGDTKLLIEKPFGVDEKSARELDNLLHSLINEDQICRIDHYLGKDTIRAIMDLHEHTPGFASLLTEENVKSIRIRLFEAKGIENRGASYEGVGAFRDVGQNHMLEMLAVLVTEPHDKHWQIARAETLKRLAPPINTCALARRGQYENYTHESGVKVDSETETAFEVVADFSSGILKGVPIILESGKKMSSTEVFIEIIFENKSNLPKKIHFSVQPKQEMIIYEKDDSKEVLDISKTHDAYEHIILSAITNSSKDFVGSEEVEALWGYSDHVVACWKKVPLEIYNDKKPFI